MEDVRPTPIPREFVEPKGFAERAGLPKITPPDPAELAGQPETGRVNDLRAEPRRRLVSELVS
jgi:hypothetical protein